MTTCNVVRAPYNRCRRPPKCGIQSSKSLQGNEDDMQNMRKFGWLSLFVASAALSGCDGDEDDTSSSAATMTMTTTVTDSGDTDDGTGDETGDDTTGDGTTGGEIDCSEPPSHAADIQPIWDANCVAACHEAGGSWQAVDLSPGIAYESIVESEGTLSQIQGLNLVEPGDTTTSFLFLKIQGTQTGAGPGNERMPLSANPLSDDNIALIEQWIACGAEA